jgi:transposase InsO family protein
MTSTDVQVRLVMRERSKGRTQEQAAVKANLKSRKTVAKYEQMGQIPSELKRERTYRTRPDPFAADWPEVERMLEDAPELEAKTLFEWLCGKKPGQYQEGQLRTLQRRVGEWRALNQEQVAVLEQVHRPGEVLQSDGTWLTELGVTIAGEPFKHVLIHCVLPYSNWEWGVIAQSESLLAYQRAVETTLFELGAVPQFHRTDNSSAVTHQVSRLAEGRTYNPAYLALLAHYGLQPQTIGVGCPEQNGDVEASNGGLKQALRQHLLLRGSRDFDSLAEYEQFIEQVMSRRNQGRQERLAAELAVKMPRLIGQNHHHLNYRHLVDSLLRKPGGFRDYRYREALFPTLVFRQAWDTLNQWHSPRKADLIYLRILRLAARYLESDVTAILSLLLDSQERWDETDIEQLIQPQALPVPQLALSLVNLAQYDALLREMHNVPA